MRIFTTLILLLICSIPTFSQVTRKLDWQDINGTATTSGVASPVKWGQFTVFQIENINKFLYKVTISGKSFELQTPIPSELQTLFRLPSADLQKTVNTGKTGAAEKEAAAGSDAVAKVHREKEKERTSRPEETEEDPLEEALRILQESFTAYLDAIKVFSSDVLSLKRIRAQLVSIAQKDKSFGDISSEAALITPPTDISSHFIDVKTAYDQVVLNVDEALRAANTNEDDKAKAIIENVSSRLRKAQTLIEEDPLITMIDDVNYLHTELQNVSNFTVTAPPVQMEGDLVSYEISVTPSQTRALAPYRSPMKFKFDVPAKGGLKVDFSVGPTISFGSKAKDDKFFLEDVPGTDSVILKQRTNNNSIAPGIAALMHFYAHGGKYIAWGGVFGIGAGFQSQSEINANLYLGLSLVFGKAKKLMGSAGFSFLRVERLKSQEFVLDKKYATSKITLGQVSEKVFKASPFISVSYNLTNRTENN